MIVNGLIKKLRQLERVYGRLPSIIATEADYVRDEVKELSLLKEAYVSACEINDSKNKSYISASLAEYYVESVPDKKKLEYWLLVLVEDMNDHSDDYIQSVYAELNTLGNDRVP